MVLSRVGRHGSNPSFKEPHSCSSSPLDVDHLSAVSRPYFSTTNSFLFQHGAGGRHGLVCEDRGDLVPCSQSLQFNKLIAVGPATKSLTLDVEGYGPSFQAAWSRKKETDRMCLAWSGLV
ncbi:hypothetical protein VFPPC_16111 [Pochonia chlamydosporia 170]|uniref:Uncharacterized protein n=1 Tax=Pochonia chlamydosporia 170 TaxID=1380566 RepID=A0A179FP49_METCM|nr:hypothetical protein VFPPC_16111 [Pochonia chlamydosporia 170]OAQ67058.1 hypothetical protein VFPPC_16111 [Pochonia chlamydosporia 170]